jgi:hypothetical protein
LKLKDLIKLEYYRADQAGHLTNKIKKLSRDNLIMNSDVTVDNVKREKQSTAEQSQMVRKGPKHLSEVPRVDMTILTLISFTSKECQMIPLLMIS